MSADERNPDPALARIEDALAGLGQEHQPAADWKARVMAATAIAAKGSGPQAIARGSIPDLPRQRRARWPFLLVPAFAAAAAIAFVVWKRGGGEAPVVAELQLSVDVRRGEAPPVRSEDVHKGDHLVAHASGGKHRAVWIYLDGELALACPGASACVEADGVLTADLETRARGMYTVVAVAGDAPLPAPGAGLDSDVASAKASGAKANEQPIRVD